MTARSEQIIPSAINDYEKYMMMSGSGRSDYERQKKKSLILQALKSMREVKYNGRPYQSSSLSR
jgi:hypothetical protein